MTFTTWPFFDTVIVCAALSTMLVNASPTVKLEVRGVPPQTPGLAWVPLIAAETEIFVPAVHSPGPR